MAIPADPNDGSLLSSVFLSSDTKAFENASALWSMTGLPEPEYGEFFSGKNADRVYLTSHGLCFSFVYRRTHVFNSIAGIFGGSPAMSAPIFAGRHIVDERILQPLLQVDLSKNCCVEIVPGVERVGADKQVVKNLVRSLKDDRVEFWAPEPEYVGQVRVPGKDETLDLIVNRRSVRPMSGDAEYGFSGAGIQQSVYGPLREQFADAWNSGSGEAFAKVLAECAHIAALPNEDNHKILHTHWAAQGPSTFRRTQIAQAASAYGHRLMAA